MNNGAIIKVGCVISGVVGFGMLADGLLKMKKKYLFENVK